MFVQLQSGISVHEVQLHDSVIISELTSLFDIPFVGYFSNVVALNQFSVEVTCQILLTSFICNLLPIIFCYVMPYQ